MNSPLSVALYSSDQDLFSAFQGLLGIDGDVHLAEEGDIILGHLVCVDMSYPQRGLVFDILRDFERSFILCVISANPFALSQLDAKEFGVDAFLAKPLSNEAVQALLVGTKARLPKF